MIFGYGMKKFQQLTYIIQIFKTEQIMWYHRYCKIWYIKTPKRTRKMIGTDLKSTETDLYGLEMDWKLPKRTEID